MLIGRFRPEPGSRPTIYVRDPSHLPRPRGPLSVAYLDDLISKYLLHQDYYDLYRDRFPTDGCDLFCVVQMADCAEDIPMSVGYSARGPQVALIPDPHFWVQRGYFDFREQLRKCRVPWEDRVPRAFWRGSSTGLDREGLTVESFQRLPRFQLCALSRSTPVLSGLLDARLTGIVQARDDGEREKIRSLTEQLGIFSPQVPQTEFLRYRFQIDIDGNSNSWSFLLKLLMGSCVLKVL